MAVVVDSFDLIARADAVADADAFRRAVPNATFCTDGALLRVSFMVSNDRDAFAASLAARVDAMALARVDLHPKLASDAAWLEVGPYAGVRAAWLRGAPPGPLVVPLRWSPSGLAFHTHEEIAEHFEYVGTEGRVEVYRDQRTGKKVYAGRTAVDVDPAKRARIDAELHRAHELVGPFILGKRDLGFFERRRVKKGTALLEAVVGEAPHHARATWLLAMSLRALGAHDRALELFRRAYAAQPTEPAIGREYAGQCFIVGACDEGVTVSRALHARFPADVGLHSNLALALLLGGDLDEALAVAEAAHARDPADAITKSLLGAIEAVRAGKRPRPKKLPGY